MFEERVLMFLKELLETWHDNGWMFEPEWNFHISVQEIQETLKCEDISRPGTVCGREH